MQVSIITQHTVNNYGSVLQTYATQKIFEKMGHQVEFVDFWRADNLEQARVEQVFLVLYIFGYEDHKRSNC